MAKKQISALQILSELDAMRRRSAAPSMPPNYIIGKKYTDKTSNGLENCICDFLNFTGSQAERIKNTGREIKQKDTDTQLGVIRGKSTFIPGTGTNGSADISATIPKRYGLEVIGRSVKIEVKIGADRQSVVQKGYEQDIINAGGLYYIAKDFTSFLIWYVEQWGRPPLMHQAITNLRK